MKAPLVIAALTLFSLSAQARLGETPAQIEARYGKPWSTLSTISTNEYLRDYAHGGYTIVVIFWNGKDAQEIIFAKTVLDDDVVKTLFTTISGKEQAQVDTIGNQTLFTTGDVTGRFDPNPHVGSYKSTLSVGSDVYQKHFADGIAAEEKKKAEAEKKKATEGF